MCIAQGTLNRVVPRSGAGDPAPEGAVRRFAPHTPIFFQGDLRTHLLVIESGWVKSYVTLVDGQRQIVAFSNAGSVLGLETDVHHASSCEAMTDVTARAIPVSRLEEVCRRDPSLALNLLRQVGRQLGAAQALIASVGAQSAEQKLATFLISMADLSSAAEDEAFDLPMRRGDVAEFLGLRLETVSRKLSDFQRRGWLHMPSLYACVILRRDILEDLADGADLSLRKAS
ncbi:helix-turn-helix domain-containing protein [bacterium]|nr:helix-turn-helix domain-containing protein [bacterium]